MKKHSIIPILLIALAVLFSCKKDFDKQPNENDNVDAFSSMIVDDNFEYKTSQEIDIEIRVLDQVKSIIEIYNGDPDNGGVLIKKGMTGEDYSYSTSLVLPYVVAELYVVRRSFDGSVRTESIPVSSNQLSYNFGYMNQKSTETIGYLVEAGTWPDCSTTADFDIPNNYSSNLSIPAGETWLLPAGSNYEGNLSFASWSTNYFIVCGDATISNFSGGKGTIVVTGTGTLQIKDNFDPAYASNLINYGTVIIKNGGSWKKIKLNGGIFENHGALSAKTIQLEASSDYLNTGTIILSEDLDANSCELTNDGPLTIEKELKLEGSQNAFENFDDILIGEHSTLYGTIDNYGGTMHFEHKLEVAGGASFYNGCKLWVEEQFKVVGSCENAGYILAEKEFEVNGGSTIDMLEGSLISVEDLDLNGHLAGTTFGYAKITVADKTDLAWGTSIFGKIDLCDADGTLEVNHASIGNDVTYCVNEVASTDCVPGTGVVINDQDFDGVPDLLDEYPNDSERAFNSYYPNANDFSSFAFEDLWPTKGDYDFNDLIINFQYKTVTNADNNIVDLVGKFKIVAAGASYNNGFGLSLDVAPANVDSVLGAQIIGTGITFSNNGLEAGHTGKSVIIVCDQINTYAGGNMINTYPSAPQVDIPIIEVSVKFGTPQTSIGTEPYNSFIYINQERGREVHLINQEPTDLVNTSLFGQGDDVSSSSNSTYYKTVENYPFAIETPVPLDYPTEKQDIVTVHLKFGNWAQTSGSQYPDWYDNKPGYRNSNKIKHNNLN
jgi:LruC domain-containing protein